MNILRGCAALAAALAFGAGAANATVVTFDSLTGDGVVPNGYGGIQWGGNWSYFDGAESPYTPESAPERIYPNDIVADAIFSFSSPTVFDGAYFSGDPEVSVQFDLYLDGNLVATSGSLAPTATPAYLASGYNGLVDKVQVVDSVGSADYWVMDNVTYGVVPEPAAWALMLMGVGGIGAALRVARRGRIAIAA
jgi:hypothetical protein